MKSKLPSTSLAVSSADSDWKLTLLVIFAVLAYCGVFYSLTLKNAPIVGGQPHALSRWLVAGISIPGLFPESPSLVSAAFQRIVGSEHLGQRIPLFAAAFLILASANGVGHGLWALLTYVLRVDRETDRSAGRGSVAKTWLDRIESSVFDQALGMNALSLMTLGLGLIGWLERGTTLTFLIVGGVSGIGLAWWLKPRGKTHAAAADDKTTPARALPGWKQRLPLLAAALVAFVFIVITYLGAVLPATDFDVREYHLQGPKEFYQAGEIGFSTNNVYRNMPFGSEMLILLSMIAVGDWWWGGLVGQAVLASYGWLAAAAVMALGRRLFGPLEGVLAGLIYLSTPWIYRISVIPYAENALAFYLISSVLAVERALRADKPSERPRCWFLAGNFAGAAAACKYTALLSTVAPLLVFALGTCMTRRSTTANQQAARSFRVRFLPLAGMLLGIVLAAGPWYVRNWIWTGNPTYPLLYGLFDGDHWSESKNQRWEWGHRVSLLVAAGVQTPPPGQTVTSDDAQHSINFSRLAEGLLEVTTASDWLSPLLFALAPLTFLRSGSRRETLWLWLFVAYFFAQWWLLTHRLNRFWIPMIPLLAVLGGAGASWNRHTAWRSFLWLLMAGATYLNFSYCLSSFCANNDYGQRLVPRTDPIDPAINWINERLPRSAVILAVGEAGLFHVDRRVEYNTVFDDCLWERYVKDRTPADARQELADRGISHVYVNWDSIARYRQPNGYGYCEFVQPSTFQRLVDAGVLRRMWFEKADRAELVSIGREEVPQREFFQVAP